MTVKTVKTPKARTLARLRKALQGKFSKPRGSTAGTHKRAMSKDPGKKRARASSNIASYAYNPTTKLLEVTFHGGRTYQFSGVPAQTYAALDGASSKGRAFHRLIRDQYPYKRTG